MFFQDLGKATKIRVTGFAGLVYVIIAFLQNLQFKSFHENLIPAIFISYKTLKIEIEK